MLNCPVRGHLCSARKIYSLEDVTAARATLRQGNHPAGRRDSGGQGDFPRSPCPEGRQLAVKTLNPRARLSRAYQAAEATLRRRLAP